MLRRGGVSFLVFFLLVPNLRRKKPPLAKTLWATRCPPALSFAMARVGCATSSLCKPWRFRPTVVSSRAVRRDFSVRIWDRTTGALAHSLLKPTNRLAFAAPEASTPCLRYSPDGKYLVAGRGDSNLLVWETSGYKLVHQLTGSTGAIRALAIAPDSKTCASAGFGTHSAPVEPGGRQGNQTTHDSGARSAPLPLPRTATNSLLAAMMAPYAFGNWIR